jgi:hypothetical protein
VDKAVGAVMLCLGVTMAFGALWLGSYYIHQYTYQDWQQFPTLMTATFGFVGGLALAGFGLFKVTEV